jgi:hypothetical protein
LEIKGFCKDLCKLYTGVAMFSQMTLFLLQGSLSELQRLTDWGDERVLYFGDHPYADLADLVCLISQLAATTIS